MTSDTHETQAHFDPSPAIQLLFSASSELSQAMELLPHGPIRAAVAGSIMRLWQVESVLSGSLRHDA